MSYHEPIVVQVKLSERGHAGEATSPHRVQQVGEFGDKFRKLREKKNISLDDVSHVTKISTRMLQAIEQEHFDQLPGGVFNKGFIRTYAKHLGMNDEEAVNGYLACMRQAQLEAHQAWEPARPAETRAPEKRSRNTSGKSSTQTKSQSKTQTQPPKKTQSPADVEELPDLQLPRAEHVRPPAHKYLDEPDNGIPWRLVAVAALVLVLSIILWMRHSRSTRAASSPTRLASVAQSGPTATPLSANPTSSIANATQSHPPTPNGQSPNTLHPATTKPTTNAAPKNAPTSSQQSTNPPQSANPSQSTNPAQSTAPPPSKPAASLALIIRASENSWISVAADGEPVSEETLIAPAHTLVRATRSITVKVGNAAGVSFLWNGQEISPQGAEAEVKTYTFDAQGLRLSSPPQAQDQNR
ncbi:MAG TPA: RodZ domain-containing protein [Candidatus Sulfotelmatobacter sp.]|nr:RodZ domain-containing protein [Candidatus Sulfotelmatobacter sp.]